MTRGLMSTASEGTRGAIVPVHLSPARSGVLRRKCDCGKHTGGGECEECQKKKSGDPLLQRSALNPGSASVIPPVVHEVLRSPGQPLDAGTRAFFEPRFGQDFSRVRVHTNALAAESASAVGAAAYAYGNNVVFGKNQFSPASPAGRGVLAHELAHVAQTRSEIPSGGPQRVSSPSDASESEAQAIAERVTVPMSPSLEQDWNSPKATTDVSRTLSRLVGPATTHCVPGKQGVPADPLGTLTDVDSHAKGLAEAAAILFELAAAGVVMGITTGTVNQVYQNRFGLPPKKGAGFLNRITGHVNKTQNDAMQGELEGIADRFDRIDKNFGKVLTYRCIHGPVSLDGCDTHCKGRDASACKGVPTFFLCPSFWKLPDSAKSTLLIHESFHMLFFDGHGGTGVGRNLRHAECMASAVSDIFNLSAGTPTCPSPPQ